MCLKHPTIEIVYGGVPLIHEMQMLHSEQQRIKVSKVVNYQQNERSRLRRRHYVVLLLLCGKGLSEKRVRRTHTPDHLLTSGMVHDVIRKTRPGQNASGLPISLGKEKKKLRLGGTQIEIRERRKREHGRRDGVTECLMRRLDSQVLLR